ncbi:methionyl-tRNA formyltransferase, partial [Candidatus Gastranaerophilus sp. (ex Termes propinquus)]
MDINMKKKIVLVGMPDMASVCLNRLVAEGFQIVALVPPSRSNPSNALISNFAKSLGVEVFNFEKSPNDPDFIGLISALEADIGLICSYDKLLSKDFLATTKMGYINCHPSLLPHYRGANPYHH